MSEFSDTLTRYIDISGIKVYDLIRYLNIDRSTMYQIIKGKRNPPSEDIILKTADFLRLAPSEKNNLLERANISRLGRKIYFQRKGVACFMRDFPEDLSELWNTTGSPGLSDSPAGRASNASAAESSAPSDVSTKANIIENDSSDTDISNLYSPDSDSPISYLPTSSDVHLCIRRLIQNETRRKKGHIRLLLQPGENFLFDILRSISPGIDLSVDHILCLSNNEEMADESTLLNIQYLNTIIPLYVRSSIQYKAWYYYDNVGSHFFHNNGFSGMILTQNEALLITSDFKQGLLIHDREAYAGMRKLFKEYKSSCRELFNVTEVNMLDFSQIQGANDTVTDKVSCYIMEREVCLLPLLTHKILSEYLHPAIPNRDMMVESLAAMLMNNRAMLESMNMHLYFTKDGLDYFAETGKFKELPDGIYIPLEEGSRIEMLQDVKEYCKRGIYRMLTGELEHLARNLRLCINGNMGYLMFTKENGKVLYMFLTEPSLLSMFQDFIENISEKFFTPSEETAEYIDTLCQKLK